ncbi:hypothetical protein P4110_29855 [Pseudomonas aeruginosa]|nr:hypothetical protein [Pseudomonas aeruginosa]
MHAFVGAVALVPLGHPGLARVAGLGQQLLGGLYIDLSTRAEDQTALRTSLET